MKETFVFRSFTCYVYRDGRKWNAYALWTASYRREGDVPSIHLPAAGFDSAPATRSAIREAVNIFYRKAHERREKEAVTSGRRF